MWAHDMPWSSWELIWGVLGPPAKLQHPCATTSTRALALPQPLASRRPRAACRVATVSTAALLPRQPPPRGSQLPRMPPASSSSRSPQLRARAAAVALAAPCLRAHSERAGRVSPVATCRAVHVLARSQEAGMDAWEWGSTLMQVASSGELGPTFFCDKHEPRDLL